MTLESKPQLLVIIGPTASGKTAAAIALAKKINGSIVSADSRQVYAGLNIGTAKPKLESGIWHQELSHNDTHDTLISDKVAGIPHYLFNIRLLNQPLTLSEWQAAAFKAVSATTAPILVGGTMLYIDSIVKNYDLPRVPPNNELREQLEIQPVDTLWQKLIARDPTVNAFIQPGNRRRIVRALEVIETTGKPFSEQRRQRPLPYHVIMLGLFPGWNILEERIHERVQQMLADGLLEETQKLIEQYGPNLPLLQTINYRQAKSFLNNKATADQVVRDMVKANLKYAKRQMSWWKRNASIQWFSNAGSLINQAAELLRPS